MKIRFANRIYDVKETRIIAGGLIQYAIEDEPNHIDWISNGEIIGDAISVADIFNKEREKEIVL